MVPVVGQYEPRYSSVHKSTHKKVIYSKAHRFYTKEKHQTWLNWPHVMSESTNSTRDLID